MASKRQQSTPPVLADERLTLVGLLLEVQRGLVTVMGGVHAAHGLQGKEFDALLRLARSSHRCLSMRDLAEQTATSTSGTTSLVDRLERRGLVTRTVSSSDRRSFDVILTDAGFGTVVEDVTALLPVIDRLVSQPLGQDSSRVQAALTRIRDVVAPRAMSGATPAANPRRGASGPAVPTSSRRNLQRRG